MENNIEFIDNIFHGDLSDAEIEKLNREILADPEFAADVKFYVLSQFAALQLLHEQREKN